MATYTVPNEYAGKTLEQIRSDTNYAMRPDVLGNQIGIAQNIPLQAGQTFQTGWQDPGSGEYQFMQKYFSPISDQQAAYNTQTQQQNAAIQPAVNSLNSSIPNIQAGYQQAGSYLQGQMEPLKARYDNLLSQLTNQQNNSIGSVQTATSREFGKRGIPTQSGAFDQYLTQQTEPINQYYTGQKVTTNLAQNADINTLANSVAMNSIGMGTAVDAVKNAIAALQAGAGKDAITNSINQYQFGQQQSLAQQQLAQALKIAEMEKNASDPLRNAQVQWYLAQSAQKAGDSTGLPVVQ